MREVTFSKTFPVTHPDKGRVTNFVKKILNSQAKFGDSFHLGCLKRHTIRPGKKFKVGDTEKHLKVYGKYNFANLWKS
jgi:hypothetical protein